MDISDWVKIKTIRSLYSTYKGSIPSKVRIYEVAKKYGLGKKIGKNWYFNLLAFRDYLKNGRKVGRPKNDRK